MLEGIETFLYRKSEHIVALTNAFKCHIKGCGIPESKISVITNGADLGSFCPNEHG